jgi:cytochrome c oxidase subunit I+III
MASLGVVLAIVSIVLRFKEFDSLIFRWDDNAYGSITWAILGVHLMHLFIMTIEDGLMSIYIWVKGLDDKHARDIRVTAVYWYWVVGMWVLLYLLIYWYPRWTR